MRAVASGVRHRAFVTSSLAGRVMRTALLVGVLCMFGCDSFFYYPNAVRYGTPEELRLRYEAVVFRSGDGMRLQGWFFPAQGGRAHGMATEGDLAAQNLQPAARTTPARATAMGTVLHLHGNAGNITGHFQHVAWLPAAGWNVLCFDYRGYGASQGRVSRAGTVADAHAALDYLLTRSDVDHGRIVAFGQSLGGAVGIVLTADRPEIRGLATDGAFDNYRRIVAWHVRRNPLLLICAWWYPRLGVAPGYDPIDAVGRIAPRPLFIMHGTADRVVDPAMARRLYEAAAEPKELWMIEGADHYGSLQDHAEESHTRLLRFFARCVQ